MRLPLHLPGLLALLLISACGGGGGGGDGGRPGTDDSGEKPDIREVFLDGQQVYYEVRNDRAIFEGDVDLGTPEEVQRMAQQRSRTWGIKDHLDCFLFWCWDERRWDRGIIPYVISSALSEPMVERIEDAIEHWNGNTSIRLRRRSDEADYVVFRRGPICQSSIGRVGGEQYIDINDTLAADGESLDPNKSCSVGNIIHEIGHTVGLFHEQSRCDRDQYIEILWDNIQQDRDKQFKKYCDEGDRRVDLPYDFASVMHYGPMAFGKTVDGTRLTTIRSVVPGIVFGQRLGLSALDIETVERMYHREQHTTTFDAVLSGYVSESTWAPREHIVGDEFRYGFDDVATAAFMPVLQGLIRFDARQIPADAEIESAILRVYQYGTKGNPFRDLGDLVVDLVDTGSRITAADFDVAAILTEAGALSRDPSEGTRAVSVTQALRRAMARGSLGQVELRLRFERASDLHGDADVVRIFGTESDRSQAVNYSRAHVPQLIVRYSR